MIHSARLICVLDTNVFYPLWIRDLLLWFAYHDLFVPKWSKHIFDEWIAVMIRNGVAEDEALRRTKVVENAFQDASVKNYEPLIENLTLPDEKDMHVLAAAIKADADLIITNNLKDFPGDYLSTFGLSAKCADDFFADMIDAHRETSMEAFRDLVLVKKKPPYSEVEVLEIFRNNGLKNTADYLHSLL